MSKLIIILQLQIFILFYSYYVLEIIKSGDCGNFYESSPTEASNAPAVIFIPINSTIVPVQYHIFLMLSVP